VFSFLGRRSEHPRQLPCHITKTTEATHEIIRGALDRSPMVTGAIEGVGPRYCPSVEDKIVRFADRPSHQVFVEPEGLATDIVYPNGISTSLPAEVQERFVRSIPGFERAEITQPGYAIEYDYFDPRDLRPSLETRAIDGLYFAGQINGTTGYEEAAAQGLVAGLNAARKVGDGEAVRFSRTDSYIGVMIDDLTTRGVSEPYRMFTSRAEYRLTLRADNADQRLTPLGIGIGCVGKRRRAAFDGKLGRLDEAKRMLTGRALTPDEAARHGLTLNRDGVRRTAWDLLAYPDIDLEKLTAIWPELAAIDSRTGEQMEIEAAYAVYLARQESDIAAVRRDEKLTIPAEMDYRGLSGLSNELVQKLEATRPVSIGQAGRIEGMTPAALTLLLAHVKRLGRAQAKAG